MFLCNIDRKVLCQYFDVDSKRLKLRETKKTFTCKSCFAVFHAQNRFVICVLSLQCLIPALHGTKREGTMCPKKLHVAGILGGNFGWGTINVARKKGLSHIIRYLRGKISTKLPLQRNDSRVGMALQ